MIGAITAGFFSGAGAPASTTAYESIVTVNPTSGTSVTFSSIPSTYKNLQLRIYGVFSTASTIRIQFNGDTAANYSVHDMIGSGGGGAGSQAGYASQNQSYITSVQTNAIATNPVVSITDILDYSSASKNKTIRNFYGWDSNGSGQGVGLSSGVWLSTAAITSITLTTPTNTTGAKFALYGIKG